MSETSTVTFIGEVTVEHDSDLSHEEVVARAFETLEAEDIDVIDVMVERDTDSDD